MKLSTQEKLHLVSRHASDVSLAASQLTSVVYAPGEPKWKASDRIKYAEQMAASYARLTEILRDVADEIGHAPAVDARDSSTAYQVVAEALGIDD